MRSVQTTVASAAAATVLAFTALPLTAQGVRYAETTRMQMAGAMGAMMSMMGGGGDETTETIYLDGTRMRRDADETSTIMDWSTGDMILLNHDQRSYRRFSWGDMMAGMAGRMEGARPEAGEMSGEDMPDYQVHFSTERTGRTEKIDGYEAEQVVMVIRFEGDAEAQPGQEMPMGGAMGNGAMAMVSELWLSSDFPAWTLMQEGRDEMVEGMRGAFSGEAQMGGMAAAMGPQFNQALEEQQEALADLDGMPLRTVLNFVLVPDDVELDVDAVLAQEDLGGGGMDAAAAARDAIAKRFNPFGGKDEEEEEPEATQSILMRATTEIEDVDTSGVDPSVFEIPEGYTETAGGPGGR